MKKAYVLFTLSLMGCSAPPTRAPAAQHFHVQAGNLDEAAIHQACNHLGWSEKVSGEQQAVIDSIFALREHRVQHALWHSVRGDLQGTSSAQVQGSFGAKWGEVHPLCPPPQADATQPDCLSPSARA
jgi:hypothetical protein